MWLTAVVARQWWLQVALISVAGLIFVHLCGLIGTEVLAPARGWSEGAQAVEGIGQADSWEGRFARWDSGYYLQIAQTGYSPDGAERSFPPLYSLVSAAVSRILSLPLLWAGLLVSAGCYVAANMFLYSWVLIDYRPQIARWAVVWLCAFPMSFFFTAFYAEPLLLLTAVAGTYFARRGNFIASALAIALAGATRPFAFLLAVPYALEFWQQHDPSRRRRLGFVAGLVVAPLGTLSYVLFLAVQSGTIDLLAFREAGATEWKGFFLSWPWITLRDGIDAALFGKGIAPGDWFSSVLVWQDLTYALLGLALAIWALFHLRPSISVYLLVGVLYFYTSHGPTGHAFWSTPRHVASLFPIYLALALLTSRLPSQYRWLAVAVSIGLLGLSSAWFASGRWVS